MGIGMGDCFEFGPDRAVYEECSVGIICTAFERSDRLCLYQIYTWTDNAAFYLGTYIQDRAGT